MGGKVTVSGTGQACVVEVNHEEQACVTKRALESLNLH